MSDNIEDQRISMASSGYKMHLIWKLLIGITQKQLIVLNNSSTNTYQLGTLGFLQFLTNQFLKQMQKTLAYCLRQIFLETILLMIMSNLSIALRDTQNALKTHALGKKAPHLNFDIKHLGNYMHIPPCSLTLMAKKHTLLLAMMID